MKVFDKKHVFAERVYEYLPYTCHRIFPEMPAFFNRSGKLNLNLFVSIPQRFLYTSKVILQMILIQSWPLLIMFCLQLLIYRLSPFLDIHTSATPLSPIFLKFSGGGFFIQVNPIVAMGDVRAGKNSLPGSLSHVFKKDNETLPPALFLESGPYRGCRMILLFFSWAGMSRNSGRPIFAPPGINERL